MSISYHNPAQRPVVPAAETSAQPESAPTAVFFTDLLGNFTGCDTSFRELLSRTAQELQGSNVSTWLVAAEGASDPRKAIATLVSANNGNSEPLRVRSKSNGIDLQLSATLVRDGNGQPLAVACIVTRAGAPAGAKTKSAEVAVAPGIICRKIDDTQFILASPVMHRFMGLVDRVAGHTETALVTGETGTGKELIARTIHESSLRRSRAWVDINCAALPENLVESELFGYEKGAFSGADASKPGLFELADKGTLFLDEIGELQLQTQVKLLRVLDGQPFYRLGGHRKIKVDVRIVAATNQDLEVAVKEGRFRQDLYHRLGQFQLRVPPLRERPEDVVALAEHFLRLKNPGKHFSSQAVSALLSHAWPGNIRELRNLVAKMAMESADAEIDFTRLSAALTGEPVAMRQTASIPIGNLESMEEQMIIKALERTGGHRTLAAQELGISRRTLSRKLKEYNINFAPGESSVPLGFISNEQQKFFRARVNIPVTVRNAQGEEISARGVNLSTGGMGLDGMKEPLKFSGLLDVSFNLPDTDTPFEAKARLMWVGDEGRVGIRFAVIEPALFEQLQHWTNKKMREEGWEFSA